MRRGHIGVSGAFVLLAALTVLAGCGGNGGASYTLDATVSCLEDQGATVSTDEDDLDFVAQDAAEGALDAEIGENSVTVMFERGENDAKRSLAAYKLLGGAFAEAFGEGDISMDDILKQKGNAVIAWDNTPTDDESDTVEGCLSS